MRLIAPQAVEQLREELAAVNEMIAELEKEYTEDELALHIAKLHEYNEIKDVAQDLLGRLGKPGCREQA